METIRIDEIERRPDSATVARGLAGPLHTEHMALNYYELATGDSFAYGYHTHEKQEEVFVILEGEVTFETESGDVAVEAGEVIRFAPGEFQQGINTGEERVVALAIGAPRETGGSELHRECADCGGRTLHTIELVDDGTAKVTRCLDCGAETGRFE